MGSPRPEVLKYVNLYEGISRDERNGSRSVSLLSQACFYMHPFLSLSSRPLVLLHYLNERSELETPEVHTRAQEITINGWKAKSEKRSKD